MPIQAYRGASRGRQANLLFDPGTCFHCNSVSPPRSQAGHFNCIHRFIISPRHRPPGQAKTESYRGDGSGVTLYANISPGSRYPPSRFQVAALLIRVTCFPSRDSDSPIFSTIGVWTIFISLGKAANICSISIALGAVLSFFFRK